MSVITSEIETRHKNDPYIVPDLQQVFDDGYIAGATRQPTDEEIEAVAETVWNTVMVPNGHRPWSESQECVMKADFIDVARTALETARGKATEDA